jgi:outer membrane protein OmpA-like peptidoglycan-associated protein/ribosomal protein S15P/S13E
LVSLALSAVQGQTDTYQWRLRLSGGTMAYYGDLSYRWQDDWRSYSNLPNEAQPWGVQLGLERRLNATFALGLSGQYGFLTGNDRLTDLDNNLVTDNPNLGRALNFRTEIAGGQVLLHFRLDNGWLLPRRSRIAPYLFAGVGLSGWRVYGDLFHGEDQRYYYWRDGSIRDGSEFSTANDANVITQDATFETRLDQLRTEEEGDYEPLSWHIPAGIGIDFRLNDQLRLGLAAQANYVGSDYLDDVSGNYRTDFTNDEALAAYASNPSAQALPADLKRGNNQPNDWYGLLSISLSYDFGVRLRKYRPAYFYATEANPLPERDPAMVNASAGVDSLPAKDLPDTLSADPGPQMAMGPPTQPVDTLPTETTPAPPAPSPQSQRRADSLANSVVYQTNNYYFYPAQIAAQPATSTASDSSVSRELSAMRSELASMRDSLARVKRDTVRVAGPAPSPAAKDTAVVVSQVAARDSAATMNAVASTSDSLATAVPLPDSVSAPQTPSAKVAKADTVREIITVKDTSGAADMARLQAEIASLRDSLARQPKDTVRVAQPQTAMAQEPTDDTAALQAEIASLRDSLARQPRDTVRVVQPQTAVAQEPTDDTAALQAEIASLRDSLARQPKDTVRVVQPQTAMAKEPKVQSTPPPTDDAAAREAAALQAELNRLRDSLARQPAPRTVPSSAAATPQQSEDYRAMQDRIDRLERQLDRQMAAQPSIQPAIQPQVTIAPSNDTQPSDAEIRALEDELRRRNRRLLQDQINDAAAQDAAQEINQLRIAELEAELARAQASNSPKSNRVKSTGDASTDSVQVDSAAVVDGAQQPMSAPRSAPDSMNNDSVEFTYQPVQPAQPRVDTIRVVSPPDTVRVTQRDTLVTTKQEILMGTSRVNVFFAKGATELFQSDYGVLDRMIEDLKRFPELRVHVKGFADQVGSAQINERLSRERAQTVAKYLTDGGISEDRLEVTFFGEENPRYGNSSLDRRVELEVVVEDKK